jgi:hypothetical protein
VDKMQKLLKTQQYQCHVADAPAVSCANAHSKNAHEHTGSAETLRPSLRNGFTAYSALPGERAFLPPSPPRSLLFKNLTPASRRQDHTASPSAPACARQPQAARPPHPTARFVTIASRPLIG